MPELAEASERITHMIRQLHGTGTKVAYITELSTELHRAVTEHLFRMLAPPELDKHACLIVMGSEGRGEYLLKTDQDNGLILEDGFDFPDLRDFCAKLTDALIEVGFPACPGEIMVRNPKWSKPLAGYRESVRDWVTKPGEQALMDIAIFYDAAPIVGRGISSTTRSRSCSTFWATIRAFWRDSPAPSTCSRSRTGCWPACSAAVRTGSTSRRRASSR